MPYIYDFIETSQGWKVVIVDTMSTEAPGELATDMGYDDNQWDADAANNNSKVSSNARIHSAHLAL